MPDDLDPVDLVLRKAEEAAQCRKNRQYSRALEIYTDLLARDPIPALLNDRAITYIDMGDYERAIEDLTIAIQKNSEDPDLLVNRGNALVKLHRFADALSDFSGAEFLDGTCVYAINGQGYALCELGEYERAELMYRHAIEIDSEYVSPRFNLALLLFEAGRLVESLRELEVLRDLAPKDSSILCLQGDVRSARGDYQQALAEYRHALEVCPSDHLPLQRVAWSLSTVPNDQLRDGEVAIQYAHLACQLTDWRDVRCLATLAAAYAESGKFDEAIQSQERVVKLSSEEQREQAISRLQLLRERKPIRT